MQVIPRYFPNVGGVEVVVQKLSETLVQKGIEVVVLSVDRNGHLPSVEQVNGVVVKRFAPIVGDPMYLPEPGFISALRDESVEIIHVHNIHTLPPVIVAACHSNNQKMLLQPHYHRYGQSPFRQALFRLYKHGAPRLMFSRTDLVIANSAYEQRIIQEDFPEARNVLLMPEGIDVNDVAFVKHEPVEPKRILYVGALKGYKNVDKVLEGFAFLMKNKSDRFKLVIVGQGEEFFSLQKLAKSLGVQSFVEWKDHLSREQLLDEYSRASVVVLFSPLESFSRVVYDALIARVPVVVLNFGALRHLVASGYADGLNSLDCESVAEALLNAAQKRYARLTLSSGEFMDWKSYSDKLVEIYERLVGR
jgi:glycosyltransferase involved in cell wall biosynthesis